MKENAELALKLADEDTDPNIDQVVIKKEDLSFEDDLDGGEADVCDDIEEKTEFNDHDLGQVNY